MKGGPKFMFTACQLNQVLRNLGAVFIVQKKDEERQNGVTLKKYAYQAIFGAIFPAAKTKTV
jgi:hypothetical protein